MVLLLERRDKDIVRVVNVSDPGVLRLFERVFSLHSLVSSALVNHYVAFLSFGDQVDLSVRILQEIITDLFYASCIVSRGACLSCQVLKQTRLTFGDFLVHLDSGIDQIDDSRKLLEDVTSLVASHPNLSFVAVSL